MSAVAVETEAVGLRAVGFDAPPWRTLVRGRLTLHFCGFLDHGDETTLAAALAGDGLGAAAARVAALDGHFALAATAPDWCLAATDRIASVSLFTAEASDGTMLVGADAPALAASLGGTDIDREAALMLGMAGFTIGTRTLDRRVSRLLPGETVAAAAGAPARRERSYLYRPWRTTNADRGRRRRDLAELTMAIIDTMIEGTHGRPILIPLSAGLDSRLVASALKERGRRDVYCYAYGRPGNHEAAASRRIAEHLGFPWRFVPYSPRQQAETFASADGRGFARFADTLSNIPFQQDLHAVRVLADSGYAPADSVFINGQSGDYITGNHIAPAFGQPTPDGEAARWKRILDAIIGKHFSLWESLKTPANLALIGEALRADIAETGAGLGDPGHDYALYEISELQNRQVKYTIAGQRIYEHCGFAWRMPLWVNAYLDFWEQVPLALKLRQVLYREMLEAENWGGVWGPDWQVNRRFVVPGWLRWARRLAKAAHSPVGRDRWHAFERRYIAWQSDVLCNHSIAPYWRVARDRRGHRNAVSWHAEAYLAAKGLALDGSDAA